MSVNPFESPRDPVELAKIRAEALSHDMFDHTVADGHILAELDHAAEVLDLAGRRFFIEAARAFTIPISWDRGSSVPYTQFHGLMLEGEFSTYSRVSIGRLHGSPNTVRALCITLRNALLLPYFETVPDDDLLYIPVLAVGHIEQSAA